MKTTLPLAVCGLLTATFWLLPPTRAAEPASSGLTIRGSVHSIQLPEIEPSLPDGPGRDATKLYCGSCHTNQYILIQPPFPRETWVAEVTKMRKAFSAPIPEDKVLEIVDYLTAVRGPEAK